ncbi:putative Osiris [Operophtera brumata]|uniref:Putative Osiris n=1 Tax=Operophtera brumata TaxID=104452 RepID=A0A0L7LMV2_OPEBR|nr:putative Osiris [Operophtera brumata]
MNHFIILTFIASCVALPTDEVKTEKRVKDCSNGILNPTCLKIGAITLMERLNKKDEVSLFPGVSLVKEAGDKTKYETVAAEFARSLTGTDEKLDKYLLYHVGSFLDTHSVKFRLLDESSVEEASGVMGEARAKTMGALALLAGKALMTALMSLLLSAIVGIKSLSGGQKSTTYEIVSKPVYSHSHSHSTAHEDVGGGFSNAAIDGADPDTITENHKNLSERAGRSINKECSSFLSSKCLKIHVLSFIEDLSSRDELNLLPGLSIVKDNQTNSSNADEFAAELSRQFPGKPEEKLNRFLLYRVQDYLDGHSLKYKLLDPQTTKDAMDMTKGDKETVGRKSGGGGGLGGGKGGGGALLAAALMAKALMSLLLSALVGLKGGGGGGKTTYEIIAKPEVSHHHSHSHEEQHEHDHGHHGGYRRAYDMGYNSYMPYDTNCFLHLSYPCLQNKTLLYLKELNNLSEVIDKAIDNFFDNHVLKVYALGRNITMPRNVEEFVGRKKRKGGGGGGGGHDDGREWQRAESITNNKTPNSVKWKRKTIENKPVITFVTPIDNSQWHSSYIDENHGQAIGNKPEISFIKRAVRYNNQLEKESYKKPVLVYKKSNVNFDIDNPENVIGLYESNDDTKNSNLRFKRDLVHGEQTDYLDHELPLQIDGDFDDKNHKHIKTENTNKMNGKKTKLISRKKRGIIDLLQNSYIYWVNKILGLNNNRRTNTQRYKIVNGVKYVYYPHRVQKPKMPKEIHMGETQIQDLKTLVAVEDFNKGEIVEGGMESRMNKKFNKMKDSVNDTVEDNPWE